MTERHHPDDEFDPNALAALTRPSAAPAAPAPTEEADDAVIDLRALSASMAPEAPPPAPAPDAAAADEMPPVFRESLAPAVNTIMTEVQPKKRGAAGIIVGVVAVAAAAAVTYVVTKNTSPEAPSMQSTLSAATPSLAGDEVSAESAPMVVETQAEANLAAPEPAAEAPAEPEALVEETDATEAAEAEVVENSMLTPEERQARLEQLAELRAQREADQQVASPQPAAPPAAADPVEQAAAVQPRTTRQGGNDMESLLDRAVGTHPGAATPATPQPSQQAEAAADLPDLPSRATVNRALGGLMSSIRQCAGDQIGIATARIRVRNDGSVASVSIAGSPFGGTPQGACMESVVRGARFPRFRQTTFDVTWPFSIRPLE